MSLGIYTFIFFIVALPGILVRRLYYRAEFSKQFIPQNIVISLFYSIIIGIGVIILSVYLYNRLISEVLGWEVFSEQKIERHLTLLFDEKKRHLSFKWFFSSSKLKRLFVFVGVSATVSYLFSQGAYLIVRKFKLDKKISFLRFDNHWFYYLRGEFKEFEHFKDKDKDKSVEVDFVRADVLVDLSNGENKLYSGVVNQYELTKKDNKLNLIYLTEVKTYSRSKKGKINDIKSECFIIPGERIINININTASKPINTEKRDVIIATAACLIWVFLIFLPYYPFFRDRVISGVDSLKLVQAIIATLFFVAGAVARRLFIQKIDNDLKKRKVSNRDLNTLNVDELDEHIDEYLKEFNSKKDFEKEFNSQKDLTRDYDHEFKQSGVNEEVPKGLEKEQQLKLEQEKEEEKSRKKVENLGFVIGLAALLGIVYGILKILFYIWGLFA